MKLIYSATITPLKDETHVDQVSLERLLKFNLEMGIKGFFFFGSMGEWALLNNKMREEILEVGASLLKGKAEIIAGISSTGLNGILENMEKASKYGVDSYAVMFPSGWAGPQEPVDYLHHIADVSDRPLYLYYLPSYNGISLTKEELQNILKHTNIKGIKNSSDSLKKRKELLNLRKQIDFLLFEGQEWVVDESLFLGCDGALVGMGSLAGKLFSQIARAVDEGQFKEASRLQNILIEIFDGIYGKNLTTVWIGQKYALELLGLFSTHITLVPSQKELGREEKKRIENCVDKYREYLT